MFITRQADYAIRVVIYLANRYGKLVTANVIAEETKVPKSFLPRIISTLASRRIVVTEKGKRGGVKLARSPREISIYDVVDAIDGIPAMNVCIERDDVCPYTSFCKMHKIWLELQNYIEERLKKTTIADVVVNYGMGDT